MATDRDARRRLPLRTVSLVALLITLAATAAAVWGARTVVDDQEDRLLDERANEVSLVLTSAIDAIPASLSAQGGILKATGGGGGGGPQTPVALRAYQHGPPS